MKAAFSVWESRIAPLFDTARKVYLVESRDGRTVSESDHTLAVDLPQRFTWLTEQGVDTLVCGAVSRPLQERLSAAGIRVIPFVAGGLREVIQAWRDGKLNGAAFAMPGCCGRRRQRRRRAAERCCAARNDF